MPGSIIEREHISLGWDDDAELRCAQLWHSTEAGSTPLIAAMRAYLATRP
jgi:hypothetical protein